MRALMQVTPILYAEHRIVADLGGNVIERFRPQKELRLRYNPLLKLQMPMQIGIVVIGRKLHIVAAALRIDAAGDGDRLKEGGLAGAVFAAEKCDRVIQRQCIEILQAS